MPNQPKQPFSTGQLRVLWFLKKNGGSVTAPKGTNQERLGLSLYNVVADACSMSVSSCRNHVQQLEVNCIVLRTYSSERQRSWGGGGARLIRLELVDKNMALPLEPKPPSLGAVMARENRELDERTAHEPDPIAMLEAVILENDKCHKVIEGLQKIVEEKDRELESLKKRQQRQTPEHLTQRVRTIVPQSVWDELSH